MTGVAGYFGAGIDPKLATNNGGNGGITKSQLDVYVRDPRSVRNETGEPGQGALLRNTENLAEATPKAVPAGRGGTVTTFDRYFDGRHPNDGSANGILLHEFSYVLGRTDTAPSATMDMLVPGWRAQIESRTLRGVETKYRADLSGWAGIDISHRAGITISDALSCSIGSGGC